MEIRETYYHIILYLDRRLLPVTKSCKQDEALQNKSGRWLLFDRTTKFHLDGRTDKTLQEDCDINNGEGRQDLFTEGLLQNWNSMIKRQ